MNIDTGFPGTAYRPAVPDRSLGQTALRLAREVWQMLPRNRARLAAAREQAKRIREVHSRVTHDVTAMVIQAEATQFLVDDNADRALDGLRAIAETGRKAIADLRDMYETPGATGLWLPPGPTTDRGAPAVADAPRCPADCCRLGLTEGRGRRRTWRRR